MWQFSESVDGWMESKEDPSQSGLSELEEDAMWSVVKDGGKVDGD